jgi:hypothetical protein
VEGSDFGMSVEGLRKALRTEVRIAGISKIYKKYISWYLPYLILKKC